MASDVESTAARMSPAISGTPIAVNSVKSRSATGTSTSGILQDVTAHVDFRTGHENRGECIEVDLRSLGAAVVPRLTKKVTHMVFKDGSLAKYNRAKKLGVHIVSAHWVEMSKKTGCKAPEDSYPSCSKQRYDSPGLFPRIRRLKSLQPKMNEDILAKIKEKVRRERAKEERAAKKKALQSSSDETESSPKVYQPVPLDFYNSPRTAVPPVEEDDENQQIIDLLTSPSKKTLTAADAAPFLASSPSSEDFDTPLAKRILRSVVFPSPEKSFKESPAAGGSSKATFTVDDTLDDVFDSDDAANNTTLLLSATPSRSTRVTRRSLAAHVSLNASRADSIRQHPTPIRPAASFAKVRPLSESAGSKKRKRVSDVEGDEVAAPTEAKKKWRPLFSQENVLTESPFSTTNITDQIQNVHDPGGKSKVKHTRTRIVRDHSRIIAEPPKVLAEVNEDCSNDDAESVPCSSKTPIPRPRRSSFEFVNHPRKKKPRRQEVPSEIVCTCLKREDSDLLTQLISKFGSHCRGVQVTQATTHVVVGGAAPGQFKRTLNVLKGILRGCWVVSAQWLLASLEADHWVSEEQFELSPEVCGLTRRQREAFGDQVYQSDLFSTCGLIYFSRRGCKAPRKDLEQLVKLGGGKTCKLARVADILVGEEVLPAKEGVVNVKEVWFFDSIAHYKILPVEQYAL